MLTSVAKLEPMARSCAHFLIWFAVAQLRPPCVRGRRREQRRAAQAVGAPVLAFCDADPPEERIRVARLARLAGRYDAQDLHRMVVGEVAHDDNVKCGN